MNHPFQKLILASASLIFLAGCGSNDAGSTGSEGTDSIAAVETPKVSEPNNVIHGMPSALHHADYLLIGEAEYDPSLTVPVADAVQAENEFNKALLLGMFQADLGYAIAHNASKDIIALFEAIKRLGDDLGMFSHLEDDFIATAEANVDDPDMLHDMIMGAMHEAEVYLHHEEGHQVADLMATGIWLENTFLATQILRKEHDQSLMDRVGEDKLILPRLIEDLEKHSADVDVSKLIIRLKKAGKVYENIEIRHEEGEIVTDSNSSITHIGTTHKVSYSQKRLAVITKIVAAIRNGYAKPKAS